MTRARNLSKLSNPSVFTVDTNNNIGVNSTSPDAKLDVIGIVSATSFFGDGSGLTGIANTAIINADQINVSGFVTATTFSGNLSGTAVTATTFSGNLSGTAVTATTFSGALTGTATGLTGTPDITVRNIIGVGATFSGDVVVGGTLTYEDVTNIDSVGIITAQSDISIADKIIHTGDTNTAIRFPAADTFTVETAGAEAIRVDSSQRLLLGTSTSPTAGNGQYSNIVVQGYPNTPAGAGHISLQRGQAAFGVNNQIGLINFGDNTGASYAGIECYADADSGTDDYPGRLVFSTTADGAASATERLRIASDGDVRVGSAFSVGQAGIVTCSSVEARVPQIPQNSQGSTYTLVKADAGTHINAGGNVTVNSGIFAIGDCISVFNDTTGDITIIQGSSVTLRLVADTGTGTRTLANYGLVAILCVGSNEFVVSGGGIS